MRTDPIVDQVIAKFQSRSAIGARKYGTTLHQNNKDNYLLHLQEELMDGCNYIEKLMTQNQELIKLVNDTPNDMELGEKIRKLVS
jgi:hypothetical protein